LYNSMGNDICKLIWQMKDAETERNHITVSNSHMEGQLDMSDEKEDVTMTFAPLSDTEIFVAGVASEIRERCLFWSRQLSAKDV